MTQIPAGGYGSALCSSWGYVQADKFKVKGPDLSVAVLVTGGDGFLFQMHIREV